MIEEEFNEYEHHFVELPRQVAKDIGSQHYYSLRPCKRGHTTSKRVHSGCIACHIERETESRSPERIFKTRVDRSRACAKQRGLEHTITKDDVEWVEECPVLDIPIDYFAHKSSPNAPHLDRIDNSKGYIPNNVFVLSRRANQLKSNATVEEIENLLKYMKKYG